MDTEIGSSSALVTPKEDYRYISTYVCTLHM